MGKTDREQLIREARGWLSDCVWADMEPEDFAGLGEAEVVAGVQIHYRGGWRQFVADAVPVRDAMRQLEDSIREHGVPAID